MIRSFRHKGLEKFFLTGSVAGVQPRHAPRLALQLETLRNAKSADDMQFPGWKCHALKGTMQGLWAVSVSGNWRLIFGFEDGNAVVVDYGDYH